MSENKPTISIERKYIAIRPNTRPGIRLITGSPAFLVAHDTGNPGATAEAHYRYFNTQSERTASAHVFIDDKSILEIIPTGTSEQAAEKAWHVIRNVTTDNKRFGYDANDAALGIELCYGGSIDFKTAYRRYVAYLAHCCRRWNLQPAIHIVSHSQLDPIRKRDCEQGLASGGKTLSMLIADVIEQLRADSINQSISEECASPGFTSEMASFLILSYIQPARHAMLVAGNETAARHYERLAANIRACASGAALPRSNCQEIIYNWLSPAWHRAKIENRDPARYHDIADALRAGAGISLPQ